MSGRNKLTSVTLLLSSLLLGASSLNVLATPSAPTALLERGRFIATAADCAACHRGQASDYSGGSIIVTPMGNIVATNITPSKRYGLGRYTEQQFKKALTQGVRADGKYLYPAMPYTAYQGMSDEDIHALWLWLTTDVAAVDKPTATTDLAFPWSLRFLMHFWNYLNAPTIPPFVALTTPALKEGYSLTEVLGHCSACHSPRNILMGEKMYERYSGGDQNGWHAPNITSDKISGIGGWRDDEIYRYLKTGNVPGKGVAAGGMSEAVEHSLRYLTDQQLNAIVGWLRQIPPVRDPKDTAPAWSYPKNTPDKVNLAGERLYLESCATCHQASGQGAYNNRFPSLTHNTTVGSRSPANLIMVILQGVHRQGQFVSTQMPAFGSSLNDQQIADLANYVIGKFGNGQTQVEAKQVALLRAGGQPPLLVTLLHWAPWLLLALILVLGSLFYLKKRKPSGNKEIK